MSAYYIPIRTYSTLNQRTHWAVRARRTKAERAAVRLCLLGVRPLRADEAATVELVRIAPRVLDDDNLRGALKGTRDQVALMLGLPDDRDPRVRWVYGQRRGGVGEYAVAITVAREAASDVA